MIEIKKFNKGNYSGIKEIEQNMPEKYGCVYIVEYGKYIKIGYTTKPYRRISNLKNMANYADCEIGNVAILPCCRNYGQIESNLHRKYSHYRKPNTELFSLNLDDVLSEIKNLDLNSRHYEEFDTEEFYHRPPSIMDRLGYYDLI